MAISKESALKKYFGYDSFREGQAEVVDALICNRDVLCIMPTGGGKSLCYQIPAILKNGLTIVVSPLVSLMRDQVLVLNKAGIRAGYVNSTLTKEQISKVYQGMKNGEYKVVYIAPERIEDVRFLSIVSTLDIALIAVDEAHCISQWGQDFRPSYLKILSLLSVLKTRPPIGAFTATATERVRKDIEDVLKLLSPLRVVTGFDRPNLYFEVRQPKNKSDDLLRYIKSKNDKCGIVYCATRKLVDSVCAMLVKNGINAVRYHAGMEMEERKSNQDDFIFGRVDVIVATNAFGMGIDKPDVAFVYHYNMPKTLEEYYQEAGRAGRDGSNADCILAYSSADVYTAKNLIYNPEEGLSLDEETFRGICSQKLRLLDKMIDYCQTTECLRSKVLEYFGQSSSKRCGRCGNCDLEFDNVDVSRYCQVIISCVSQVYKKCGFAFGKGIIVKILTQSKSKRIEKYGLDQIPTYGLLKDLSRQRIADVLSKVEELGFIEVFGDYSCVRVTEKGEEFLLEPYEIVCSLKRESALRKTKKTEFSGDRELYEKLRKTRNTLAQTEGVPPYVICTNKALEDISTKQPTTIYQLLQVSGIGKVKARNYGEYFLKTIGEYLEKYGLNNSGNNKEGNEESEEVGFILFEDDVTVEEYFRKK